MSSAMAVPKIFHSINYSCNRSKEKPLFDPVKAVTQTSFLGSVNKLRISSNVPFSSASVSSSVVAVSEVVKERKPKSAVSASNLVNFRAGLLSFFVSSFRVLRLLKAIIWKPVKVISCSLLIFKINMVSIIMTILHVCAD